MDNLNSTSIEQQEIEKKKPTKLLYSCQKSKHKMKCSMESYFPKDDLCNSASKYVTQKLQRNNCYRTK